MFKFKNDNPKERLSEFGSREWVDQNIIKILGIALSYLITAYLLADTPFSVGFLVMGLLPLISAMMLPGEWAIKPAMALQCFWYVPFLFWQARNEEI